MTLMLCNVMEKRTRRWALRRSRQLLRRPRQHSEGVKRGNGVGWGGAGFGKKLTKKTQKTLPYVDCKGGSQQVAHYVRRRARRPDMDRSNKALTEGTRNSHRLRALFQSPNRFIKKRNDYGRRASVLPRPIRKAPGFRTRLAQERRSFLAEEKRKEKEAWGV